MLVAPDGKETVLKIFSTTKCSSPSHHAHEGSSIVVDRKHLYIACSDGWLQINSLQLAGKKRMDAQAFINGVKDLENYSVK
jgi:methionyl-tRNA formyltransferase